MAVYKRGRFYWVKFEFAGKRHQFSARTQNQAVAKQIEAKQRTDLALGLVGLQPRKPGMEFQDYAEKFREYVRTHSADHPETISFYLEKLRRLLEYRPLASCRLNFIDEALIESYIQHRRKTVSITTVNRELATLRRALNIARKKLKLMTAEPEVCLLSGEPKRTFVLSYAQEAAYLAVCEQPLKDAAVLMLDTGLRVGEAVKLKWADFEIRNSKFERLIVRRGKTENAARVACLSQRIREMLDVRTAFFPEEPYLFPGASKGTHILVTSLDHQHARARNDAILEDGSKLPQEFVIHSLRHTFGTRFGQIEPNVFNVKAAMGHGSVTVSERYIHPMTESLERAFERLDQFNQMMREAG